MTGGGIAARQTADALLAWLRGSGRTAPEVTRVETHLSWVFLAGADVYKLKKAIRLDEIDFSTPERRRRNCLEEVRLNRRLAPDVYRGVLSVTREADGSVALAGAGPPIDWVVHMRRLPDEDNLERVIRAGRVAAEAPAIHEAAGHLARFFASARRVPLSPAAYLARLVHGTRRDRDTLRAPRYALPRARVEALARAQLSLLATCARLFELRARHIVDAHGDLRPEHIWLGQPPAIIDCIEFDRALRTLDPVDDLAFLDLECERLGQPEVGAWFFDAYTRATFDTPPSVVAGFYRVYRALRRATIAARHLDDPLVADPGVFLERARAYLEMVEPVAPDGACVT
jgi:aminoglycoside phosphotransferase family enzyme